MEDGTKCYWAGKGAVENRKGEWKWESPVCRREKRRCELDTFFENNKEHFLKIKKAIDDLSPEQQSDQLKGFSEVIGRAMTDLKCLLDYKTGCKKLADAIIAVESIKYKSLFSQNIKESRLLTTVLKQAFYYLPPNESKGVLVRIAATSGNAVAMTDLT